MDVQILAVPYDSARRGDGMGAGPEHWLARRLENQLTDAQHNVRTTVIDDDDPRPAEIKTAFALNRALAQQVAAAKASGRFPLVLSGNCNTALGTLSGVGMAETGIVWFDAHGDFNTPDTTDSGFFDGMGLAIAAGIGWRRLAASIPGFSVVPGANIIHVGGRAFDADERELMVSVGATVVDADTIRRDGLDTLNAALAELSTRVRLVYIHLDLDVLDPDSGFQANRFPEPHGLSVEQVLDALQMIKSSLTPAALTISAYDPTYDQEDRVLNAGFTLLSATLESQHDT
jgi:arginase